MADEKLATKKTKPAKGLLSKESMSDKPSKENNDIYNEVAGYIAAIRKQKMEIMNGKS